MASMFEKEVCGFTEDFDPNAEPGVIAGDEAEDEAPAAPAPEASVEEAVAEDAEAADEA